MNNRTKLNLLVLTSSFPRGPNDETCGYVRDFARSLSDSFQVRVLAPADRSASEWPADAFTLNRSASLLPRALDPFQASSDFNSLLSRSLLTRLASSVSLLAYFLYALKLALRADAICSHWLIPCGLMGALISRLLGKPHVVVEHSGALHLLARMPGGGPLTRYIIGGSRRIVTVSADLKSKLVAFCPDAKDKVEVAPMGVGARADVHSEQTELRALKPAASQNQTILFIGRLTEVKGLDVLLRAAQGIKGLQLLVAGDGEQKGALEKFARELSVNAIFFGQIEARQRDSLLSLCDAVVIPSLVLPCGRTEGMPVVCFEAMAAGCPVIASRAGGLAEMIVDGQNGLLFIPGAHEMLADRLRLVLNNPALRQRLSENARETAAEFSWSQVGSQFCEIVKDSLRKNGSNNRKVGSASC